MGRPPTSFPSKRGKGLPWFFVRVSRWSSRWRAFSARRASVSRSGGPESATTVARSSSRSASGRWGTWPGPFSGPPGGPQCPRARVCAGAPAPRGSWGSRRPADRSRSWAGVVSWRCVSSWSGSPFLRTGEQLAGDGAVVLRTGGLSAVFLSTPWSSSVGALGPGRTRRDPPGPLSR